MKKVLIIWISLNFVFGAAMQTLAQSTETDASRIAKIKKNVLRIEKRDKGRITAKLANGTEIKGTIESIDDSDFTVTEKDTNTSIKVAYSNVRSTGSWVTKGDKRLLAILAGMLVYGAIVFPR
jgi:hypothetical protein